MSTCQVCGLTYEGLKKEIFSCPYLTALSQNAETLRQFLKSNKNCKNNKKTFSKLTVNETNLYRIKLTVVVLYLLKSALI